MNKLFLGDTFEILPVLKDESVDLIFIDPPYFMQTEGNLIRSEGTFFDGINEEWDKFGSFEEYDNFTIKYLKEIKRIMKKNASLWIIGSFQNIYRIGNILQNLGFWIINDIIWKKSNPTPNFKGTRFTNSHETLLWVVKNKNAKYTFNYKTMKYLNGGKQMGSVWEIPICAGKERVKTNGKKAHPSQKPEKLLENIILATSKPKDVVLDPFMGVGTTPAIAKRLGRKYVGIEKEKKYFDLAKKRVEEEKVVENPLYKNVLDIKPPKVKITDMIKKGYFKENENFLDKNENFIFKLDKNGKLQGNSIHKLSAELQNKINFNGWEYWYVKRDNKLVSINKIRKEYWKKETGYEHINRCNRQYCHI